jgi:two-component system chemotaxis response regulator CheY
VLSLQRGQNNRRAGAISPRLACGSWGKSGPARGGLPLAANSSPLSQSSTVLVVDDDPDILEALSEILEAEGFEIRRARNGKEALERLEPEPPQLILLDLMMPVMDGWEFAQRMRQRPPEIARIPIIVLSADRNVGSKAADLGAVGHLAKPFELNDLLELVRRALEPAAVPAHR